MKQSLIILAALAFFLGSCKDKYIARYKVYEPVYMDLQTFRSSVAFEKTKNIEKRGSICLWKDYLFVVETNAGVHFIDNSNPSSPVNFGFLRVPGCSDIAVKGQVMYVSSLIDLVCINIEDVRHPYEFRRMENLFPDAQPICFKNYPKMAVDPAKGLLVNWNIKEIEEETDEMPSGSGGFGGDIFVTTNGGIMSETVGGNTSGISGSISRFAISGDYLYVYDAGKLTPINISNPELPLAATATQLSNNIETLFPYGNYLFMGTTTGMLIYSLSSPESPGYVSMVAHMRSCDPVVVQGNYAYVTVRSNSFCGGNINELQVIDISSIENPVKKATFGMKQPHGLGIDGENLFICDGSDGLKIFDASDPETSGSNMIERYRNIEAIDVIPHNNRAIVIGENGIFQYDYSNRKKIKLLSTITIQP